MGDPPTPRWVTWTPPSLVFPAWSGKPLGYRHTTCSAEKACLCAISVGRWVNPPCVVRQASRCIVHHLFFKKACICTIHVGQWMNSPTLTPNLCPPLAGFPSPCLWPGLPLCTSWSPGKPISISLQWESR